MDRGRAVIGVDFGTQSGRAAVFSVTDGALLSDAVMEYPSGILTALPDGTVLPESYALQKAADYRTVLFTTIREAVEKSGMDPEDIVGIGIDVTSSTFVPLDEGGRPLSEDPGFINDPHAYVKLWKHHGAQEQAARLSALALERNEPFMERAGGVINSEWMLPKLLELYEKAPEVYAEAARFTEIADWLVELLTGNVTRGISHAGYKMLYSKEDGGPSEEYLEAAAPGFSGILGKLQGPLLDAGAAAGYLTKESADILGLPSGITVASSLIDAHVTVPAAGITGNGEALLILGTSCCMVVLSDKALPVPGISGCVKDAVLPGCYAYEAGQSAVGDMFAWAAENAVSREVLDEAKECHISVHEILTRHAAELAPGEIGLLALDWWNGNRSCLADADLSGLILGLRLSTKPWEVYRALLESSAFGMRRILEEFSRAGVPIEKVRALGGIVGKNPLFMQIYADILKMPVYAGSVPYGSALGSAIYAAMAAGKGRGGYDSPEEAIRAMGDKKITVYRPDPEAAAVYDELYRLYSALYDDFGKSADPVMHRLLSLKNRSRETAAPLKEQA
ncbi:MAG: ribulokinase [Lachnospiraceae bacterium]|nr:ribulokinase [Lachnospiraceae bacterium]